MCRAERCGKPFGLQSTPVIDDLPWLPVSALVTFGLCGLCWGGVSWCPMSDLPLCTQVSGTPQPPTPVSWSGGALSRLAHCRLFPSQAIHLHLLAKLSYSALCCLSSGYMAKGPDRERFFLKRRENLSVSVGTKDKLTSLPFIRTRGPLLLSPPHCPSKIASML